MNELQKGYKLRQLDGRGGRWIIESKDGKVIEPSEVIQEALALAWALGRRAAPTAGDALPPLPNHVYHWNNLTLVDAEDYRRDLRAALANQPAPTVPAGDARVEYVPIAINPRDEAGGAHPSDKTPFDPACQAALDEQGDDRGRGLDPYWKWGFRAGWQAGRAHQPAQEQTNSKPD